MFEPKTGNQIHRCRTFESILSSSHLFPVFSGSSLSAPTCERGTPPSVAEYTAAEKQPSELRRSRHEPREKSDERHTSKLLQQQLQGDDRLASTGRRRRRGRRGRESSEHDGHPGDEHSPIPPSCHGGRQQLTDEDLGIAVWSGLQRQRWQDSTDVHSAGEPAKDV